MTVSGLTIHFFVEPEYNSSCQKILIFGFQRVVRKRYQVVNAPIVIVDGGFRCQVRKDFACVLHMTSDVVFFDATQVSCRYSVDRVE
jgi:hypothetical protein